MTHVLAALLAALSVDPSFAPTIVYPPSAWTNAVRSSSVPGSVAFSNATLRLDAHASAAMFGTYDAFVARQILPYLVNYGEASGKTIGDVASGYRVNSSDMKLDSDMTWHDAGEIQSAPFTSAAYRDFSGLGYRFGRLKELMDDDIIGDANPEQGSFLNGYVKLERWNSSAWLVPDINHDALPTGEWHLDNEAATADWNQYLLTMAELVATNVPPFTNASPFNIYAAQTVLPRRLVDTDGYLREGGFPRAYDVAGMNPFEDAPVGSVRGRLHASLLEMLAERSSGIDFSGMTNRPSSRVWWERQAFANSLLSCCSKLMLFWNMSYWPLRTNDIVSSVARSPGTTFRTRQVTGTVYGSLTKALSGDEETPLPLFTDRDNRRCYFDFNSSEYVVKSSSSSSDLFVMTNYTQHCDAAYSDSDSTGSLSISLQANMTRESFGPILDVIEEGRHALMVEYYADDVSFIPYPRLIAGDVPVCLWKGTTNWTSVLACSYCARLDANIPLDIAQYIGPTQHECTADEDEWYKFSFDAFVPHKMLFDSKVIESVSVHSYDSSGVSTNLAMIKGVSTGNQFSYTRARDEGPTERRDCWAAFRQRLLGANINECSVLTDILRSSTREFGEGLHAAHSRSHTELPFPDYSSAVAVSLQDMSSIMEATGHNSKLVVSNGTGPKGGFDPGIDVVKDETGLRLFWRMSGSEVKPDDFIAIWIIYSATIPIPEVCERKSAAVHFESNPFTILNLNFKKMTYKKD